MSYTLFDFYAAPDYSRDPGARFTKDFKVYRAQCLRLSERIFHLCYFFVVLFRLSVSVQAIDWIDSSLKWPVMC